MVHSVFSPVSICSSAILRACLSNSKDALMSEALKLIVQFRLRGSEDDDIDDAREEDEDTSIPEYVTLDSDAPSGKYASLFTFTSNQQATLLSSCLEDCDGEFHRTGLRIEPVQALEESVRCSALFRCSSQAERVGVSIQDRQK